MNRLIDLMGGWLVTIANNNATLWPYLAIKDLPDFPLWMENKIGPSVAIFLVVVNCNIPCGSKLQL